MKVEASLTLADFRRKHGISNATCHRHIAAGLLKTVRGAAGRQRVMQSDEYRYLFGREPESDKKPTERTHRAINRWGVRS